VARGPAIPDAAAWPLRASIASPGPGDSAQKRRPGEASKRLVGGPGAAASGGVAIRAVAEARQSRGQIVA